MRGEKQLSCHRWSLFQEVSLKDPKLPLASGRYKSRSCYGKTKDVSREDGLLMRQ